MRTEELLAYRKMYEEIRTALAPAMLAFGTPRFPLGNRVGVEDDGLESVGEEKAAKLRNRLWRYNASGLSPL